MVALLFFMICLHGSLTVWGSKQLAHAQITESSEGAEEAGFMQLGSLVDSPDALCLCEVSITAPNSQCRLLNAISSLTECMHTKNKATVLCPRSGGFEPRGNAYSKSDNTQRVSLWSLELKTYTRTWNSTWMDEYHEWSVMPWNVHEIIPYLMNHTNIMGEVSWHEMSMRLNLTSWHMFLCLLHATSSTSKGKNKFAQKRNAT